MRPVCHSLRVRPRQDLLRHPTAVSICPEYPRSWVRRQGKADITTPVRYLHRYRHRRTTPRPLLTFLSRRAVGLSRNKGPISLPPRQDGPANRNPRLRALGGSPVRTPISIMPHHPLSRRHLRPVPHQQQQLHLLRLIHPLTRII